jgi:hypothetical protein
MPSDLYELTLEEREKYFYACVVAPYIDVHIAVAYLNELMEAVRKTRHKKVLFARETPMMQTRREYAMIASVIANMLPADVQFAVVDRSPSHPVIKQCILDERERKHRHINAFDTFEEAEAWLLAEDQETV